MLGTVDFEQTDRTPFLHVSTQRNNQCFEIEICMSARNMSYSKPHLTSMQPLISSAARHQSWHH
jgi:hypothetical protein